MRQIHTFNYLINLFFLLILFSCESKNSSLVDLQINEFLAINETILADNYNEFDDWVELLNYGAEPINIGGYYLSDKLNDSNPYMIPDTFPLLTTIDPNEYIILWCDRDIDQGPLHLDFKLSGNGESIILLDKDGKTIIDQCSFIEQSPDISMGKVGDDWLFMEYPTPGEAN